MINIPKIVGELDRDEAVEMIAACVAALPDDEVIPAILAALSPELKQDLRDEVCDDYDGH